jgi:hypothetical protein
MLLNSEISIAEIDLNVEKEKKHKDRRRMQNRNTFVLCCPEKVKRGVNRAQGQLNGAVSRLPVIF